MWNWQYDEYKACGVDYSDEKNTGVYDNQHQSFRDYKKEYNGLIDFIGLSDLAEKTMIDFGCGTGSIAFFAADEFKKVFAIDVSESMLEKARSKVDSSNSISFIKAGFLSYQHKENAVDLVCYKTSISSSS